MDRSTLTLEFAKIMVDLLKAFAWPVGVFAIAVLLRREVAAALKRLRSLKHGETEFSFNDTLEKAQQSAVSSGITTIRPWGPDEARLQELAKISPRSLIIESWRGIEKELRQLAGRVGLGEGAPLQIMRELAASDFLPRGVGPILDYLKEARNRAVHTDEEITEGEALEFHMLSKSIKERLQSTGR